MTGDQTRRALLALLAALALVIGGGFAAFGEIDGLGRQSTSASPSDEPGTDDSTDESTEDEQPDGDESEGANSKAPCTLKTPPNRAAGGTDADRHPGWSRGKHFGWCVAASRHETTGRPDKPGNSGSEKHVKKPARPGAKLPKEPHPGKGHGKHH